MKSSSPLLFCLACGWAFAAFHADTGDDHVPAEGSAQMYPALRRAGVQGNELHIYPRGGYGYGLRPSAFSVVTWPARAGAWMLTTGWLQR